MASAATAAVVVTVLAIEVFDDPASPHPASRWSGAVTGVCSAADAAREGESERAQRVFFDEAVDPLHELAGEAGDKDRAAAASLLRALERVHTDFDRDQGPIVADLNTLVDQTRNAVRTLGDAPPPACSTEETP